MKSPFFISPNGKLRDGESEYWDFVGNLPVRHDIEVLPADGPKQLKLGWSIRETIGVAVICKH